MWHEQKVAFKTFIRILENSMVEWDKKRSLPQKITDLLESSISQLKIMNEHIGGKNLEKQMAKINELMTVIIRNSMWPLSEKVKEEIMHLKAELEKQQEIILLTG